MTNFHEEERREKAARIIGLVDILRAVEERLAYAATVPDGGQAMDIADHALDRLVALLSLCSPLANRRECNGRIAFMWIQPRDEQEPLYRWIVCNRDGSFQRGSELSQRACEDRVERLLQGGPDQQ
ncbi:MAG: hypothetical protein HYS13_09410 [Planctomycetia bacterium]|nr:hypothetical protein [Planctomycetia bacterium]